MFCLNLQQIGGIETSTLELLRCLALRQTHQYYLLLRNGREEKLQSLGISIEQVTVIHCDEVEDAASQIRNINPDVIQLYKSLFFFEAIESSKLNPLKVLVYHSNQRGENFFLTQEVDRVVCVSKSVQMFLSREGIQHTSTIPNGVAYRSIPKKKGERIIFTHLGRRDIEEKKIDDLLTFWRRRKHFRNACLHIFGCDRNQEEGDIVYRQFAPRELVLSESDYVLSFSRSEGFGMAIAEALISNVPVICRPCGGVTDYLQDNKDVFFFDDEDSFNELLSKLENGELDGVAVAKAGGQKILELFNLEKAAACYESLYMELYESRLTSLT